MIRGTQWKMITAILFSLITLIPVSFGQNILVLNEQCQGSIAYFPTALTNMGYAFTETSNDADFYAHLTDGTAWDLVIVDEYYNPLSTSMAAISAYITGGGKCYMNYWQWDSGTAAAFEASLGAAYDSMIPVYRWDTSHALFNIPNTIPDMTPTLNTCITDGYYLEPMGAGVAVAGYTATPTSGQAACIVGNNGRTILMGEIIGNFVDDADADSKADLLEFAENVVAFFLIQNETCPGLRIPLTVCPGSGATIMQTGSTVGADDDIMEYPDIACASGTTASEHVYHFTPTTDIQLQIDLEGSSYDTKLAIVSPCPTGADFCMYNDDYADTLSSGFDCTLFSAGVTYYIVVYGFGDATGDYVLNLTECGLPTACQPCPCYDASLTMTPSYQTVSGAIEPGACDVFAVELAAGQMAEFTFCAGGGAATFDTYLTLRDSNCAVVAYNDDSCNLLSEITYEISSTGMYYLEVNSCCTGGSGGDYTLAYQYLPSCLTCPDYNYQITPTADYQTHASSIIVGGCKIYEMVLTAGNTVTFTFCEGGGSVPFDSYLRLYDGTCLEVAYNDDFCGGASQISYQVPSDGIYYLQVTSYLGAYEGGYTLAYRQSTAVMEHCFECPEYDYGTYYPWTPFQTHSDSFGEAGCRWYEFYLEVLNVDYVFTVCQGGGTFIGDSILELYDSGCNRVAYNDDTCGLGSEIVFTNTTAGYYYLRVSEYGGSALDYTLAYRLIPICPGCPNPEFAITPTVDYQTISGSVVVTDCDLIEVAMTAGCSYIFTFCEGGGTGDFDTYLNLYDGSCNIVAANDDSCGLLSHLQYDAPIDGIYYLEATSCCTGGGQGSYTLAYRVDCGIATPTPSPSPTAVPTEEPTPTPELCLHTGDPTLDGEVTAGDAQLAFYIALGAYTPSMEEACAADCNGDDEITAGDAQLVFMVALGASPSCADPL